MSLIKAAIRHKGSWTSKAGNEITRLGRKAGARYLIAVGKGNAAAVDAIRAGADRRARDVLQVIEDIRTAGPNGESVAGAPADRLAFVLCHKRQDTDRQLIGVAEGYRAELNAHGILNARGGQWYATTVRNLLAR
jgi:hypothetical protein